MSARRSSDRWSTAAVVLGALLLLMGILAVYVRDTVLDGGEFTDRGVSTLDDADVRTAIAERAVDTVIEAAPDLVSVRPLLLGATEFVIDTDVVRDIVRFGLFETHATLLSGDSDAIAVRLADVLLIVNAQARALLPEISDELPSDLTDALVTVVSQEQTVDVVSTANEIRAAAFLLPLLALVAYGAAIWMASRRRSTLVPIGVSIAAVGATLVIGEGLGRLALVRTAGDGAATAVWDAFVRDVATWGLVVVAFGVIVAAGSASLLRPIDLGAVSARLRDLALSTPRTLPSALVRVVVSFVLGVWLLVDPGGVVDITVRLLGLTLLSTVVAQVLARIGTGERADQRAAVVPRERLASWSVAAIAFVALVGVLGWLTIRSIGSGTEVAAGVGCNGSVLLCDRAFDEVVVAATHNSNSAAADDYLVANHSLGIISQLDAGYRGLLIDTYYGVSTPGVDLVVTQKIDPSGDDRDQLVAELGEDAVVAAEALRARQLDEGGEVGFYLCHNLCELGATPLDQELVELRRWLERNPREVLTLFIQDELTPEDTARAFEDAGLEPFLHEQDLDAPFPTLGEMIDSGRRVFVMAENDAGDVPWYHDGFAFSQETPFSFGSAEEFSCDENRGSADSPLFLVNHFITPATAVGGEAANDPSVIVDRVRECERVRGAKVTMVAIDFFARGDTLAAVDELNGTERPDG